jgi:hypothetical protein
MDAQTTSPAGQPATDPQPRAPEPPAPTAQGEVPASVEASAVEVPASTETPAGAEVPASTETPAGAEVPASTETPAGAEVPAGVEIPAEPRAPGFRERGRMRRRVRFLRKARELAYRDLGGLVFEMHRLGQRHDELVAAKLAVLVRFDEELRGLEAALGERLPVTVLREAGIAACPRCAAIHGSGDRFCPACGLPMGHHADRPVTATPVLPPAAGATPVSPPEIGPHPPAAPGVTPSAPALAPPAAPAAPAPATTPTPPPALAPTPAPPPTPTPPPALAPTPAPPPTPTPPPATANPPVAARPPAAKEDRPTEIIRPPDAGT